MSGRSIKLKVSDEMNKNKVKGPLIQLIGNIFIKIHLPAIVKQPLKYQRTKRTEADETYFIQFRYYFVCVRIHVPRANIYAKLILQ